MRETKINDEEEKKKEEKEEKKKRKLEREEDKDVFQRDKSSIHAATIFHTKIKIEL